LRYRILLLHRAILAAVVALSKYLPRLHLYSIDCNIDCNDRNVSIAGTPITMGKPVVLVSPFPRTMVELFDSRDLERLAGFVEVAWGVDAPLPAARLEDLLPDLWSYVGVDPPLSRKRLERAPRLGAILEVGGHFPPTIDYAACFTRGIRVLSCAPAFAAQVAEMALTLTLCACRGAVAAHLDFLGGKEVWQGDRPTDFTLFEQAVGFIGFGAIARALLPLLHPFRCSVKVHDPWLPASLIAQAGCTPAGLDELLATSRVIYVLAVPAPENRELLGSAELALMRPGALLVLISRAHFVDFAALTAALATGRIQAAIDVFPQEPMPLDAAIRHTPNVILSPHRAASLRKERQAIGRMVVDDLELMANGLPPVVMQAAQPEIISRRIGRGALRPASATDPTDDDTSSARPLLNPIGR
jgi:phosphoglycerate dehydrogenase-like enzyme